MSIGPINVSSSHIQSAEYDDSGNRMILTFRDGRRYEYEGVDRNVFQNLIHAPSVGRYFVQNIKNVIPAREL